MEPLNVEVNPKARKTAESINTFDVFSILMGKSQMKGATSDLSSPVFDLLNQLPFFSEAQFADLEQILHIKIKNRKLFKLALLHRSTIPYLQKKFGQNGDYSMLNNERLEFLGDSVFNFIISEFLFLNIDSKDEGLLSNIRSKLINRPILGEVARKLQMEKFVQVSFNAKKLIDAGNLTILSNAMESVVGAIFLDQGFKKTEQFILRILLPLLASSQEHDFSNYKSILMELVQSFGKSFPTYHILGEEGPDHKKKFIMGVYIDNKLLGTGMGITKKEAEQNAAKKVMQLSNFLL